MANKEKILEGLQFFITNLAQQADGHVIQSKIFASEGFNKLATKYAEHAAEERAFVDQFIDRMIDLGGDVRLEAKPEAPVYKDPVEWVKHDLQVSIDGLAFLAEYVEAAREDYTTFDMLKAYYQDEEEDLYWGQAQVELIECIGKDNWLLQQL